MARVALIRSNWPGSGGGAEVDMLEQRWIKAALIINAIQCVAQRGYLEWIYPKRSPEYYARKRKADLEWFLSDRERIPFRGYECFTFRRCCEDLGIDHRELREVLRSHGWLDGRKKFSLRSAQTRKFIRTLEDPTLLEYFDAGEKRKTRRGDARRSAQECHIG